MMSLSSRILQLNVRENMWSKQLPVFWPVQDITQDS